MAYGLKAIKERFETIKQTIS